MNLILTGDIGIGKSTALREALRRIDAPSIAGYFTHWNGPPRGTNHIFLDTWNGSYSAAVALKHNRRFQLNEAAFMEGIHIGIPTEKTPLLVIDELGILEFQSPLLVKILQNKIQTARHAILVIQKRALNEWSSRVPDVDNHMLSLNSENSAVDSIVQTVHQWFGEEAENSL